MTFFEKNFWVMRGARQWRSQDLKSRDAIFFFINLLSFVIFFLHIIILIIIVIIRYVFMKIKIQLLFIHKY